MFPRQGGCVHGGPSVKRVERVGTGPSRTKVQMSAMDIAEDEVEELQLPDIAGLRGSPWAVEPELMEDPVYPPCLRHPIGHLQWWWKLSPKMMKT